MVSIEIASAGEETKLDMVEAGRGRDESGIVQYNDKLYMMNDDTLLRYDKPGPKRVDMHPQSSEKRIGEYPLCSLQWASLSSINRSLQGIFRCSPTLSRQHLDQVDRWMQSYQA